METDQRRIEVYQEYPLPYELYCERDTFKYHYFTLYQSFVIGILTSANLKTIYTS